LESAVTAADSKRDKIATTLDFSKGAISGGRTIERIVDGGPVTLCSGLAGTAARAPAPRITG
jgi:hypothetical protein